jgi:hypothetical protein
VTSRALWETGSGDKKQMEMATANFRSGRKIISCDNPKEKAII